MSAWTILVGNSTAPASSTAWVHLNNQDGSGACPPGGDFVCINTDSFSSGITETEEGYTLVSNNYNTAIIETELDRNINTVILSTEVLTTEDEVNLSVSNASITDVTETDDTVSVTNTDTSIIIKEQT